MLKLFFNGDSLEFILVNCHLGLLFSENLSWTNFINAFTVLLVFWGPGINAQGINTCTL